MVASDTVVGIVGAVVLVAVMAGVFVYEYNNPQVEEEGDGDAAHLFADEYPELDANGDVDGDGKTNVEDDDLDGDGTANANDTEVGVTVPVNGNRPQQAPPGSDAGTGFAFHVDNGSVHIIATVTYQRTSAPVGNVATPSLVAEIRDSSGTAVATGTTTGTTTATITVEVAEPLPEGNYTLHVRRANNTYGAAVNFSGQIEVHYGMKVTPDHEH